MSINSNYNNEWKENTEISRQIKLKHLHLDLFIYLWVGRYGESKNEKVRKKEVTKNKWRKS
jgi:hypothetical protein